MAVRRLATQPTDSVEAYVKHNTVLARSVIEYDDVVDEYFNTVKKNLIEIITGNPADSEYAMDLFLVAKYFERIGDHAVNIAEWVVYAVTGVHKEADG